jgi:hypothetical protein
MNTITIIEKLDAVQTDLNDMRKGKLSAEVAGDILDVVVEIATSYRETVRKIDVALTDLEVLRTDEYSFDHLDSAVELLNAAAKGE